MNGDALPDRLPIFPLPEVVLFPGVTLPLHVFEPRYRAMTADALAQPPGRRLIVPVLLKPGWEEDYEGTPAVHAIATAGEIVRAQPFDDGRYLMMLRGTHRVRLAGPESLADGGYRMAALGPAPEIDAGLGAPAVVDALVRLLDEVKEWTGGVPVSVSREDLESRLEARRLVLNTVAFHLTVPAALRQDLLVEADLARRLELLSSLVHDALGGHRAIEAWRPRRPDDPRTN
jgi:Lon protease-like protein